MPREPEQELKVSVERVLFPAETEKNADWFILKTSQGICKGSMSWRPRQKERLKLVGKYGEYQGNREFKFVTAALDIPTDLRGMLHYVCEMASGVGTTMEQQIWDKYGEDWANIKENDIPRLSGKIFDNFTTAIEFAEQDRFKGEVIASLLKAGCTMNMASAAYEKWQKSTMGVVSSNPYRLAELPNYGFNDVDDKIRHHFGIKDDDPKRIRAAIIYVLRQITNGGSTLVKWESLNTACISKLSGFKDLILLTVSSMFEEGTLKGFKGSRSVALAKDYDNESLIWNFINQTNDW